MPYLIEQVKLPRIYDRRVHIMEDGKEEIKNLYKTGISIRAISRKFSGVCSRRLIQFILFPERLKVAQEQYQERRKDGRYYDPTRHCEAIRNLRRYKHDLRKQGILKVQGVKCNRIK